MTTTCPAAPRQARGLRGAALRRLAGNKCPRIYQTHDLRPSRCDARPLAARWHGEAMTNEAKKSGTTAERLASRVVVDGRSHGFADGVVLRWPDDRQVATIDPSKVLFCNPGQELVAVRAWLVQQIEAGYHAGVEAGRAEAKPAPTDAAAEDAAIDGLVSEAIRQKGDHIDGHDRTGRWCLSLGDTRFDTRHEVARGWLRPWLLAAWARGVAYGQGDISSGESRCAAQLANALGHPGETLPTWEEALAMVTRDRQPTPGDFFGMAAREQVAAERAVDAAAVALSDEDSIRATFVKSEIEGLKNEAEDLANEIKNLRRSRDSAIAAARVEGAAEAFRKVVEWCQTAVPDGIDLDAGIVEEVAKDAIGTLRHAAGAGDEKMREEGRRAGWKEAVDMMGAIFDQKIDDAKLLEQDEERLRKKLAEVAERKADNIAHAAAIQQALACVRLVAPKEAP